MEENRLRNGDRSHLSSASQGSSLIDLAHESRSQTAHSDPQHFCIVTETYPPEINGVALTLANLVKGLLARGHTVSVVHPKQRKHRKPNGFDFACCFEEIGVR